MNDKLVSVIIPVYNVEKYLPACVESVLAQTYQNLQIILVDDGSTDKSPEILDSYGAKDDRILVIHRENGGLSAARNTGLDAAAGDYVTFLDSDDFLCSSFVERLYQAVEKADADVGICDYKRVDETAAREENPENGEPLVYSSRECLKRMYQPRQHGMEFIACAKLYKRELFRHIRFPEGKLHEDTFTTYRLIYAGKSAVFLTDALYCYRVRSGSIMTRAFDLRRCDVLEATEGACGFFREAGDADLLQYALNAHLRMTLTLWCRLKKYYHGPDAAGKQKEILRQGRKALRTYGQDAKLPVKKRLFYGLFFIVPSDHLAKMAGVSGNRV